VSEVINPILRQGDIVFDESDGIIGWAIRRVEGRSTHARAYVNHVALVTEAGPIFSSDPLEEAVILDAQPPRVSLERLSKYRGDLISIYRPLNLTPFQKQVLAGHAVAHYNGHLYGYSKIALHYLGLARYAHLDTFPICSWTVAKPMEDLFGMTFGGPGGEATPESMWDFCRNHPEFYEEVLRLGVLDNGVVTKKG